MYVDHAQCPHRGGDVHGFRVSTWFHMDLNLGSPRLQWIIIIFVYCLPWKWQLWTRHIEWNRQVFVSGPRVGNCLVVGMTRFHLSRVTSPIHNRCSDAWAANHVFYFVSLKEISICQISRYFTLAVPSEKVVILQQITDATCLAIYCESKCFYTILHIYNHCCLYYSYCYRYSFKWLHAFFSILSKLGRAKPHFSASNQQALVETILVNKSSFNRNYWLSNLSTRFCRFSMIILWDILGYLLWI